MVIVRGPVPGVGWGRCPVRTACSPLVFAPPVVAASPVAPLWVLPAGGFGDCCPKQRAWPWGAAVPSSAVPRPCVGVSTASWAQLPQLG